ncbi:MAG: LPS assembly lipoprotein LptE [Rhodospirillaceae bacterium]
MGGPTAALGLILLLGACGFKPMMGTQSDQPEVAARLAQIKISNIKDHSGQMLRNKLIDRFYHNERPVKPEYQLDIILVTGEEALAVQRDASVSRGQWTVSASYRMLHIASGQVLMTGSSRAVPGYNSTFVQYASFVSEENALERGIDYISDEINNRVALYFARDPDQQLKTNPITNPITMPKTIGDGGSAKPPEKAEPKPIAPVAGR